MENMKHQSAPQRLEILINKFLSFSVLRHAATINVVVNNKDDRVFMSERDRLIVTPWKIDVLKTSIFALEASLLGQIFVLRTSNFRGATISR